MGARLAVRLKNALRDVAPVPDSATAGCRQPGERGRNGPAGVPAADLDEAALHTPAREGGLTSHVRFRAQRRRKATDADPSSESQEAFEGEEGTRVQLEPVHYPAGLPRDRVYAGGNGQSEARVQGRRYSSGS